jgi:hypothetical protein
MHRIQLSMFVGPQPRSGAGLGIAVGCRMGERERALQIIGGISIPLLFLSGFAFPVESIHPALAWLSHALPSTAGIRPRNARRASFAPRTLDRHAIATGLFLVDAEPSGPGTSGAVTKSAGAA